MLSGVNTEQNMSGGPGTPVPPTIYANDCKCLLKILNLLNFK